MAGCFKHIDVTRFVVDIIKEAVGLGVFTDRFGFSLGKH